MTDEASPAGAAVSAEEITRFFDEIFPGAKHFPETLVAEKGRVVVRMDCQERHLRPGGFISGPTQMGLADHAAYVAVFTEVGIKPMALTSNLNINFLRPCQGAWLEAEGEVLKFGRSGVVVEVTLRGEKNKKPSAHATVTYVLPKEG